MNQETIRLVLEYIGRGQIAEATAELEKHKNKVKETADAYQVLDRNTNEFVGGISKATAAEEKAAQAAVEATQAHKAMHTIFSELTEEWETRTIVSAKGLGQAIGTKGNDSLGRGILQSSYAVQDFTSQLGTRGLLGALGSVQNNIPVIAASLGAGAGLAGVVSLVAVGLGIAADSMGKFGGASKDVADAIKKVHEEAERLAGMKTPESQRIEKDVTAYVTAAGPKAIQAGIASQLLSEALAEGQRREANQLEAFGVVTESQQQFVERTAGDRDTQAKRIFGGLPTDPSARAVAARMAREVPGAFPGGFAEAMARVDRGQAISGDEVVAQNKAAEGARREIDRGKDEQTGEIRKRIEGRQRAAKEARDREEKATRSVNDAVEGIEGDIARSNKRDDDERLRLTREKNAYEDRLRDEQAREAKRAADKARHDSDPSEQLQRQAAQRQDQAAAEAIRQNNQGGIGMSPDLLQQVARMAAASPGDINANVQQAIQIVIEKWYQQQQQMQALGQTFQQFGQRFQSLPMTMEPFGGGGF